MKRTIVRGLLLASLLCGWLGAPSTRAAAQEPRGELVAIRYQERAQYARQEGLLITVDARLSNLQGKKVWINAYFQQQQKPLRAKSATFATVDGTLTVQKIVTPDQATMNINGMELFLPYDQIDLPTRGSFQLSFFVQILHEKDGKFPALADSKDYFFTFPPTGGAAPVGGGLSGRWTGNEDLAGFGSLVLEFEANGMAYMTDKEGRRQGTWKLDGSDVTLGFYNGSLVYRGKLAGETMSGTATAGSRTWNWRATREGGTPPPPPPPPPTGQVNRRVHVVLVGVTDDKNVGENAAYNINQFKGLFEGGLKAEHLGSMTIVKGRDVTPRNVLATIDRLNVAADEALFVMCHIHGGYDPRYQYGDPAQGHFFWLGDSGDLLRKDLWQHMRDRRAGLTVLVSESCYVPSVANPFLPPPIRPAAIMENPALVSLLLHHRGYIDVNACSKGESSWNYEKGHGSMFTNAFVEMFYPHPGTPITDPAHIHWPEFVKAVGDKAGKIFRDCRQRVLANTDAYDKELVKLYREQQDQRAAIIQMNFEGESPTPITVGLSGRWAGSEDLKGYGDLAFEFAPAGVAYMIDPDGRNPGTWKLEGSKVTLAFYEGTVVYRGTLAGSIISGTASNASQTWNWRVAQQSGKVSAPSGPATAKPSESSGPPPSGPPSSTTLSGRWISFVEGDTATTILEFAPGGVVYRTHSASYRDQGSWKQTGNEVAIAFGYYRLNGTINGNKIAGTANTNRPIPWTWLATKLDAGAAFTAPSKAPPAAAGNASVKASRARGMPSAERGSSAPVLGSKPRWVLDQSNNVSARRNSAGASRPERR